MKFVKISSIKSHKYWMFFSTSHKIYKACTIPISSTSSNPTQYPPPPPHSVWLYQHNCIQSVVQYRSLTVEDLLLKIGQIRQIRSKTVGSQNRRYKIIRVYNLRDNDRPQSSDPLLSFVVFRRCKKYVYFFQ